MTPRNPHSKQGGFVVVLAALLLVVIMAMAALVADGGLLLMARTDLSNAVDLAAIAGAAELPDQTVAASIASSYVEMNANRLMYPEFTPIVTFPTTRSVRVEAGLPLSTSFLGVLGLSSLDVGAEAEATRFDPDVVLIIDRSGSMCRESHGLSDTCPDDGTPWQPFTAIQATAHDFIDQISGEPQFALISYSTTAFLDVTPTTSRGLIHAGIDKLVPGGYTDIAGAVTMAIDQVLLTLGPNPKLIVLLTDGVPNRVNGADVGEEAATQAVLDVAAYAAEQGIIIHGINYGDESYVDNNLMRQVAATTEGAFYFAPDEESLGMVYTDIADRAIVRLTYVD